MAKTKREKTPEAKREIHAAAATAPSVPDWNTYRSGTAAMASRIPAWLRASKLVTGTVASLPLVQWRAGALVSGTGLLSQPEPDKPYWVTMQRTTEDVAHHAKAYWEVRDVDANGYPARVRLLPAAEVSQPADRPNHVRYTNHDYPISHPAGPGTNIGSVIVFDGYRAGILTDGFGTIALAIALEHAALNYADSPLPSFALKNDGADLTPAEIQELLTEWETARLTRSTAYLSSAISTLQFGWSASELQLTDARTFVAGEIARLWNLDPLWVGASMPGASLVYGNRVDLRKDLVDLTLTDYMAPIEQRLSMHDVTPTITDNIVRFNTNAFLRSNLPERSDIVVKLMGTDPPAITLDEARAFLSDSPITGAYPS